MQATQTVSHVVSQSKSATLSIPKQIPQHITQTEFVLLLSLRGRFSQLEEHVGAKEAELKARLEGGRSVAWREIAERLGDRLYGEGEGFPAALRFFENDRRCTASAFSTPQNPHAWSVSRSADSETPAWSAQVPAGVRPQFVSALLRGCR